MVLLKRIAISNGDIKRKEAATTAIIEQSHDTVTIWNEELKSEIMRRIMTEILAGQIDPSAEKTRARCGRI